MGLHERQEYELGHMGPKTRLRAFEMSNIQTGVEFFEGSLAKVGRRCRCCHKDPLESVNSGMSLC
jgi:hypothetical protein